jgi:hypothetical protein
MVLINAVHHYYPKMVYAIKILLSVAKHLKTFYSNCSKFLSSIV